MVELKRCPFCGTSPRTEVRVTKMGGTEDQIDFSVYCTNCGVNKTVRLKITGYANFIDVDKAESDVITAWNQRYQEKVIDPWDGEKPHAPDGFVVKYCEEYDND